MNDRPKLDRQFAALTHCVAWAGKHGVPETVLRDAEFAIDSFAFLVRYQREFKALVHTLQAFPDAEIEARDA